VSACEVVVTERFFFFNLGSCEVIASVLQEASDCCEGAAGAIIESQDTAGAPAFAVVDVE